MSIQFEDFEGGESVSLGDELNNKLNALKTGVNLAFQWRGQYAADYSYSEHDVISYAESKWLALAPSEGVTPTEGASWTMLGGGGSGAGSAWIVGSGVPSNGIGSDGYIYLNDDNGDVYQKTAGAWSFVLNIKGANGANGAPGNRFRFGSGSPDHSVGIDGDWYFDQDSGAIYERVAGTYIFRVNVTGPAGVAGGVANWIYSGWVLGGEFAANDALAHEVEGEGTGSYIAKVDHTATVESEPGVGVDWQDFWMVTASPGAPGEAGAPGVNGTVWHSGTTNPGSGIGNNNEFYFNTSNADIWKKIAGTWTYQLNLKGLKGDNGDAGAGYGGTSTSSLTIATGSKAFTTQTGKAYQAGARVRATDTANVGNWMEGVVSSYAAGVLTVAVDLVNGAGTVASWNLNIAGERGGAGAAGAAGSPGAAATVAIGTVTTVAPGEPATVVNSGTSSAAVLNIEIPQGENGEGSGIAAKVSTRIDANQNIPNNVFTNVAFDEQEYSDGDGFTWSALTPTIITATETFDCLAVATVEFDANATGARAADIMLNGATMVSQRQNAAGSDQTNLTVSDIISVEAGDEITLSVKQNSGGALDLRTETRLRLARLAPVPAPGESTEINFATEAEAIAGVAENVAMNPLRTKQAIAALAGGGGGNADERDFWLFA